MDRLANKIREARENKRLTQTKLAQIVGAEQSHISRIETGKFQPSLNLLEKICQALNLSYEEMLEVGNYKEEEESSKLGVRIRQARKAKRLTQKKLAQIVGVTRVNISAIEKGKHQPSMGLLEKICYVLGLSYEEMLEVDNYKEEEESSKLGVRIRRARRSKRLTQTELAQLVAISTGGISKIETGKYQPSKEMLEKICYILGLSYEEMLKIGNYKLKKSQISLKLSDLSQDNCELVLDLVKRVSELTPKEKDIIKFILS